MKVGIFGGTFNPVHYGYLINAAVIKEEYSLDLLYFVPSKTPVHKEIQENVTAEDRYEMTRIAVENRPGFEVSRIEIDRKAESYMVYTVRDMKEKHPGDDIFLIIGYDSYIELDTWRQYEELLSETTIIVMDRVTDCRERERKPDKGRILFADNPLIEISSTDMRNRLKQGKTVAFMAPDTVIEYIINKRVYTT